MRNPVRRVLLFLTLCALVLGACSRGGEREAAREAGDPPLCDPAVRAVEDGPLDSAPATSGHAPVDSVESTGAFARTRVEGCERVSLALLAGEASVASAPALAGRVLRSYGIVRLDLPAGVTAVGAADTSFESGLVGAAFVVHGRDGRFSLDLHLAAPALVRPVALAGPARLALDLAPGGGAVPAPAPRARNVVLLEPRAGRAAYPLTIRGYARTFESNVIARLLVDGKEVALTFGTAADGATTWGEFELTIPSGPKGRVDLFVGENSAKDGTPIGVTVPLTL